jgi:hypothetical protein
MNKHKSRVKEIMENNGDISREFFNVSKTFVTWQESLQKKPTRKMKMMQKVFECGSLKTRKGFLLLRI